MFARTVALVASSLALSPAIASAETALNVIPHGQYAKAAPPPWASEPGILPADFLVLR